MNDKHIFVSCLLVLIYLLNSALTLKISGDACVSEIPGHSFKITGKCTVRQDCPQADTSVSYCRKKLNLVCCLSKMRKSEIYALQENSFIPYNRIEFQIIDGFQTTVYPHMVTLGYFRRKAFKIICGGVLISNKFVLTTAHCFKNYQRPYIARLGVSDLDDSKALDVQTLITVNIHPEYDYSKKNNDIALLQLKHPVSFTENIRPACLWQKAENPPAVSVVGFGATDHLNKTSMSRHLLKTVLKVSDQNECKKFYEKRKKSSSRIFDTQFCGYDPEGNSGACYGDSGGPVNCDTPENKETSAMYVAGLVSFGNSCGGRNEPSVMTKIFPYLDWIENIVWPDN